MTSGHRKQGGINCTVGQHQEAVIFRIRKISMRTVKQNRGDKFNKRTYILQRNTWLRFVDSSTVVMFKLKVPHVPSLPYDVAEF